ncbi:MAG: DUF3530 family protein [Gammaproteobacteria bacterium]|nr:MAG: DUF3530 family protein [Gammaproteobacteria bacterium]
MTTYNWRRIHLKTTTLKVLLLTLLFSSQSSAIEITDKAREKRVAAQIEEQLVSGDPIWLEVDGEQVFALDTPAESDPVKGTVILVHGNGAHPNWAQVIAPLRAALAENGWRNVAVQMPYIPEDLPVSAAGQLFANTNARIRAAVEYAMNDAEGPLYIVSHSRGGHQASYFVAASDAPVKGLAIIGSSARYQNDPDEFTTATSLGKIKIPVLDMYGSEDLEQVVKSAAERKKVSVSKAYTQKVTKGADHMWDGEEQQLTTQVLQWLDSLE